MDCCWRDWPQQLGFCFAWPSESPENISSGWSVLLAELYLPPQFPVTCFLGVSLYTRLSLKPLALRLLVARPFKNRELFIYWKKDVND